MDATQERGWARAVALAEVAGTDAAVAISARLVGTDRSWAHAGDATFPAASTIKLAILVALFRQHDAGGIDLARSVTVGTSDAVPGSGVLAAMAPGLALPIADLAFLMVAVSDNTASNLLLDAVGDDTVRQTIVDLGMDGTALNRRFLGRLPGPGEPENLTTAADLTRLLAAVAEDRAASPTSCARMRGLLALQQDRDRLARRLPPGVDFGGKSGSLPGLVHDCGLLSAPAGTLAVAVLTRGIADPYAAQETIGEIAVAVLEEVAEIG